MPGIGHNSKAKKQVINVKSLNADGLQRLKKAVLEMSDSYTRVDAEKELQKSIVEEVCEELSIDKRIFRKISKAFHNASFQEEVEKQREYEESYEMVEKTVIK